MAPPAPAIRAAQSAPRGQVSRLSGGHYAAFLDGEEQAADVLVSFLDRALAPGTDRSADGYAVGGEPGVVVARDLGGR